MHIYKNITLRDLEILKMLGYDDSGLQHQKHTLYISDIYMEYLCFLLPQIKILVPVESLLFTTSPLMKFLSLQVSEEYKLVPDTLYLTVYLIDIFLSRKYIERQKLQLLGITSMLIAS
jgi:cyclin A